MLRRNLLACAFAIGVTFTPLAGFGQASAGSPTRDTQTYLKDIGLDATLQLTLRARSAVTASRLRVFVDYSQYRGGWMPRTRAYIGEISEPVSSQTVRLQLINSAVMPNGGVNDLWWGAPEANHPVSYFELNPLVPAFIVRARVAIVAQSGAEQHHYFLLVRSAEKGGRIGIIPARDADAWIGNWEGSAN